MLRGFFVAALAAAALVALPAAAYAEDDGPQAFLGVEDGAFYPQGYELAFGFLCYSPLEAIVSCESSQPLGSSLDTFHAGPHTVWVTATDYWGRQATATATYTVIDITRPHVVFRTPTEGATFELGAVATLDYSCEDDPGGLGIVDGGCFGPPVGMPIDTSRIGDFSIEVVAADRAFNSSQQVVHYSVVDHTPPTIEIRSPADGATYTLGQQVYADFSCDDVGSGLSSCKRDSSLDTSTVGSKSFTVTAYDRAGNVARETHSYSVLYDFSGFAAPAVAYPGAAAMKAGEAVPLKFSLNGDQGSDVFAAGSPGWAPCGALDGPSRADGALSYNAAVDRYTFLAPTPKSWAGTCWDLIVKLRDGTTHRARFSFTK